MKKKTHRLSIFLLKDSIHNERDAIHGIDASDLKKDIIKVNGESLCLYYQQTPSRSPSWVSIFSPHTTKKLSLLNSGCSAVLILKRKGRYFALTFGYGRHLLNHGCYEENFGLRVVVNAVDPQKLKNIDVHTLESIPVHKKSQASVSTSFGDFGLDVEQDLMYAATGKPKDDKFCKTLSGKDSLVISLPFELADLPSILDKTLPLFESNDYKKNFPWIDSLSEVRNQDLRRRLDEGLIKKVAEGDFSKTWLAIPDVIEWERVAGFRYQQAKRGELQDDISWSGFIEHLQATGKTLSFQVINEQQIHCINSENERPLHTWKVYRCIYCEIDLDGISYSLTNGKWYKIAADFLDEVNRDIKNIPIADIVLPEYAEKSEGDYNKKAAEGNDNFFLMDKNIISYGGGRSKIEVCDLLSKDKKFVHVKRYGGSSVLSHLFSQGLVAIQLILSDDRFRSLINKKLPETHQLPAQNPAPGKFEVVYAIASNGENPSVLDLPLFSKINLRSCCRQIRLMGVAVSLCFIPVKNDKEVDVLQ